MEQRIAYEGNEFTIEWFFDENNVFIKKQTSCRKVKKNEP